MYTFFLSHKFIFLNWGIIEHINIVALSPHLICFSTLLISQGTQVLPPPPQACISGLKARQLYNPTLLLLSLVNGNARHKTIMFWTKTTFCVNLLAPSYSSLSLVARIHFFAFPHDSPFAAQMTCSKKHNLSANLCFHLLSTNLNWSKHLCRP